MKRIYRILSWGKYIATWWMALLLPGLASPKSTSAQVLCDVTFETPYYTNNYGLATGAAPYMVSYASEGMRIETSPATGSQAAAGRNEANRISTVSIQAGQSFSTGVHQVSMDWIFTGPTDTQYPPESIGLTVYGEILTSAPSTSVGLFGNASNITAWSDTGFTVLGPHILGALYHATLTINLDDDTYLAEIQGLGTATGTLRENSSLSWLSADTVGGGVVDNIRWEIVPEPATQLLIPLGLLLIAVARKRRENFQRL